MKEHEDNQIITANGFLLDRQIFDAEGVEVGRVDDLELGPTEDGGGVEVTALLCGPSALALRIGDRLGLWWAAFARRFRADGEPGPFRIPLDRVVGLDRREARLRVDASDLPAGRAEIWTRETIIGRIPGNRR